MAYNAEELDGRGLEYGQIWKREAYIWKKSCCNKTDLLKKLPSII